MRACLFDTDLGPTVIVWADHGVLRVHLAASPKDIGAAEERTPDRVHAAVIRRLQRHLSGDAQDFSDVTIDLRAFSPFRRRVYAALRTVTAGQTISYGELAARAQQPRGARAVGSAMAQNPCPILIPCHRVLLSDGSLGHFSAAGGTDTKRWLLMREGRVIQNRS